MKIDEALYQLKQNIKMHKIEGTTSNQNEREKVLLDYITNLQEELEGYKQERERILNKLDYVKENERLRKELELCKKNGN